MRLKDSIHKYEVFCYVLYSEDWRKNIPAFPKIGIFCFFFAEGFLILSHIFDGVKTFFGEIFDGSLIFLVRFPRWSCLFPGIFLTFQMVHTNILFYKQDFYKHAIGLF